MSKENAQKDSYLKDKIERLDEKFKTVLLEVKVIDIQKTVGKGCRDMVWWTALILVLVSVVLRITYNPHIAYFPSVNKLE